MSWKANHYCSYCDHYHYCYHYHDYHHYHYQYHCCRDFIIMFIIIAIIVVLVVVIMVIIMAWPWSRPCSSTHDFQTHALT